MLALLSAAMGIAGAVVAATVIGSINEQFDRMTGSPPTGPMTFAVVITVIVSLLMIVFGVWCYLAGSRSGSTVVTAVWALFSIVLGAACITPGWFTGAFLYADPGGSGRYRYMAFVELIPSWLSTTSLALAIGKVVTFLAAAILLSATHSRAAQPPRPQGMFRLSRRPSGGKSADL
ncbi:hypothetical protein FJK98_22310 [Micromonospora sp. HM134]|uniref:hypothetical protein n=1 Tax=Micromonospora sp. HM134 TaxID=2583243 RepID=UPI001198C4B1|nr:hypothetical protein [Micromonospora sp. HM134]QDY09531.1 hypothetical protein FJK98_22310 [Micromonospora sp. HM134]